MVPLRRENEGFLRVRDDNASTDRSYQLLLGVDIIYLVEVAKSTDIICLISKELSVTNS
jgi:hypothetical protein